MEGQGTGRLENADFVRRGDQTLADIQRRIQGIRPTFQRPAAGLPPDSQPQVPQDIAPGAPSAPMGPASIGGVQIPAGFQGQININAPQYYPGVPGTYGAPAPAPAQPGVAPAAGGIDEQRIREIFAEEYARHRAAVDAQMQAQGRNQNVRHIREGMNMIRKGRWARLAWMAAGIAGTTAVLTATTGPLGVAAAPYVTWLMSSLFGLTGSFTAASTLTGAAAGAAVFTPLWALRGAGRIFRADRALRREYGQNIYVEGKIRRFLWEGTKGAVLGGVIGALLGYPYKDGKMGAEFVKDAALSVWNDPWKLWTTPKSWLSWLWGQIPWPTGGERLTPCVPRSAGGHCGALLQQLGVINSAFGADLATGAAATTAAKLGAVDMALAGGVAGAGILGARALGRRRTEVAAAQGVESGPISIQDFWRDTTLTPQQRAILVVEAQDISPGTADMREVVKVVDPKFGSVRISDVISRLPWDPNLKAEAMKPFKRSFPGLFPST